MVRVNAGNISIAESNLSLSHKKTIRNTIQLNCDCLFKVIQYDRSLFSRYNHFGEGRALTSLWDIIKKAVVIIFSTCPKFALRKHVSILECGVGSRKAAFGLIYYSDRLFKVIDIDYERLHCLKNLTLFEKYKHLNLQYMKNYSYYLKDLEAMISAQDFDILFYQIKGDNLGTYSSIIDLFNNSSTTLLLLSCNRDNFEPIESDEIEAIEVSKYQSKYSGGKTHTTF